MDKLLLKVPEACARLSVGRSKLYELIASGQLPVARIGSAVRIAQADLERYVERLTEADDLGV